MIRAVETLDGSSPHGCVVSTQEELLAVPWVHEYEDCDCPTIKVAGLKFARWSVIRDKRDPQLMVEYTGVDRPAAAYRTAAHILEGIELLTLPAWMPPSLWRR